MVLEVVHGWLLHPMVSSEYAYTHDDDDDDDDNLTTMGLAMPE